MRELLVSCLIACGLALAAAPAGAEPQHAIAMHGAPKLADGFTQFPYVDDAAVKGGRVRFGALGSFDSLNPFIIKGEKAAGVRDFVFEGLMARGQDEPFTLYGLIAERVEVPEDRSSVTFYLNEKAKFSDGVAITADDVIFSLQVLRDKGVPTIFGSHYKKVKSVERVSDRVVRMLFNGEDRELPLILGLLPVLPKHKFNAETFDQSTLLPLVGSGPYTIDRIDTGRSISFKRNPDYWGRDLPVMRGRFNFNEIRYDYFRDASVLLEAFKSGLIDLRLEDDPLAWSQTSAFAAAKDGSVQLEEMPTGLPAGMNALVFNTRRAVFADPRVRQALILLFDFEWINATLYNGRYARTQSFFERSYLSSVGRPADDVEKALLAPFADKVKPEVMDGSYRFPVSDGSGHNRANAHRALELLQQAGYALKDGRMVHVETGKQIGFELLISKGGAERLMLAYVRALGVLGINAQMRTIDSAQLTARTNKFDFDMVKHEWLPSLSPGNEQWGRFGSGAAKAQGSRNLAGVDNPAADAMITAMLAAKTPEDFNAAVRAFDRVLLSGDYVIPLFHVASQWVAYWRPLQHPKKTPLFGYNADTWWAQPALGP